VNYDDYENTNKQIETLLKSTVETLEVQSSS